MTTPRPKNLMELVGRVCDEQATPADVAELNRLLKSDSIAREEYLDQLLIDGLLQYEFAGHGSTESPISFSLADAALHLPSRTRLSLAVGLLVALGACFIWWSRIDADSRFSLGLRDSSFEEASFVSYKPRMSGWYGDTAYTVPDTLGVSPPHGKQMLRLVRSASEPADSCEVYQIVDLMHVKGLLRHDPVFVEASASVNSLVEDPSKSYVFAMHLYASPDDPLKQPSLWPAAWRSNLSFVGNQLMADFDHESWQQIRTVMPLQADARFLLIQISVRNESGQIIEEFPGQFVDNVQLKLTATLGKPQRS